MNEIAFWNRVADEADDLALALNWDAEAIKLYAAQRLGFDNTWSHQRSRAKSQRTVMLRNGAYARDDLAEAAQKLGVEAFAAKHRENVDALMFAKGEPGSYRSLDEVKTDIAGMCGLAENPDLVEVYPSPSAVVVRVCHPSGASRQRSIKARLKSNMPLPYELRAPVAMHIDEVRIDDVVATYEGPRKVTKIEDGRDGAVRLTFAGESRQYGGMRDAIAYVMERADDPEWTKVPEHARALIKCLDCKGSGQYLGAGYRPVEACRKCGGSGVA